LEFSAELSDLVFQLLYLAAQRRAAAFMLTAGRTLAPCRAGSARPATASSAAPLASTQALTGPRALAPGALLIQPLCEARKAFNQIFTPLRVRQNLAHSAALAGTTGCRPALSPFPPTEQTF
jgi:hypothetical protein